MIHDLKPYLNMKDSGVPSLGQLPAHWEVFPLCVIARPKSIINKQDRELLSVYLGSGVIRFSDVKEKRTNVTSDDLSKYQAVDPGDLVLNNQQAWRGSVGVSKLRGIVSPAYLVLSLDSRINSKFADLLFREKTMVDQYLICSKGVGSIQRNLYWPSLKRSVVLIPPPSEQFAIVRFVEYVDHRIRTYIRTKQKLIKLLEEQKQTIIHRAVTRGLNPNVRLKPSGVEWLGDVPGHWEVRRLKSLVKRVDHGVSPQAENYLADNDNWGVLKAGCVNRGVFREKEHKRLPHRFVFDSQLAVAQGDVLVSRASGSPNLVGSVGRVVSLTFKLILSDKTFRPVFLPIADPDFMVLAMNSRYYRSQVEAAISGAEGLANNLPLSSLRTFFFALPPLVEQEKIVHIIRGRVEGHLATIVRTEREISLLLEYRTRIIADVVTGKLDVRTTATRLIDAKEPGAIAETDVDIFPDDASGSIDEILEPIEA